MRTKITLLIFLTSLIFFVTSCGISKEEYSRVYVAYSASQAQVTQLQAEYADLKSKYASATFQRDNIQNQLTFLQFQLEQGYYPLKGKTSVETAQNIVRYYYHTHIYSAPDSFVCGDMAIDVWDMCKAQGISAIIQIGSFQRLVTTIIGTDHTWVQAEVSPGRYLALDPTKGEVIWEQDNPRYYIGWLFENPDEYKKSVAGHGTQPIPSPENPFHIPGYFETK